MMDRTHDLAALTGLVITVAAVKVPEMTVATAVTALIANMLGSALPDADQPTSGIWEKIPAGSIIGRLIYPLLGTHRMISHSIIGYVLVGYLLQRILPVVGQVLLVDMNIIWWALMIGYATHIITDSFTIDGIPLLFPFPFRFGLPPIKKLRIKTGGMIEKTVVFPGLLLLNSYIIYTKYPAFVELIRRIIR